MFRVFRVRQSVQRKLIVAVELHASRECNCYQTVHMRFFDVCMCELSLANNCDKWLGPHGVQMIHSEWAVVFHACEHKRKTKPAKWHRCIFDGVV